MDGCTSDVLKFMLAVGTVAAALFATAQIVIVWHGWDKVARQY